jgi:formate hydrogenlyase transcriptional activator
MNYLSFPQVQNEESHFAGLGLKDLSKESQDLFTGEKITNVTDFTGEGIPDGMDFQGIIGQSTALRQVMQLVEMVAESDATVLLLGETGTGKELVAQAIHERSQRQNGNFVTLNCAAIPGSLFESELFGHERGAFTGAHVQRVGRLEVAHRGTLFLDEVGEMPLELQPKLLRALQERAYERVGSARTKSVDLRLVAATNCDLEQMIAERQFRSDLYYRLNVFPIRIPPLRERREDIPLLVQHFTRKYARRMKKRIETIPAASIEKLMRWHWPGNVRELENLIERSVILTTNSVLAVSLPDKVSGGIDAEEVIGQYEAQELIVRTLRETGGRVSGPNGAAARLGLKRSTLLYRMNRLGINARKVKANQSSKN